MSSHREWRDVNADGLERLSAGCLLPGDEQLAVLSRGEKEMTLQCSSVKGAWPAPSGPLMDSRTLQSTRPLTHKH